MDSRQQRIADDLAGAFEGELRFDRVSRSLYATDASLYQVDPLGVASPRHAEDVVLLARYAAENGIPLVPRGAGTGLAGGALGSGLIVDFSRHLTAIEAVGDDTVRVQPGVVRDQLNRVLKPLGRYFPPDPANSAVTTIGGMLGVDAAGAHACRVGSTRDHVLNLDVVMMGGQRATFAEELVPSGTIPSEGLPLEEQQRLRLISRVAHLLRVHRELIQQKQPPLIRNCAGYHLRSVLSEQRLHLPRLLVGSEGTLAMTVAATLHTAPLPLHRGVGLLLFGRMDAALQVVQALLEQQPSACDLLDRRLLSLGRESDARWAECIPQAAEAGLIVEQTGYTVPQVQQRLRMAIAAARRIDASMRLAAEAYSDADVEQLWSLPQKVVPNLIRLVGETRPLPFIEDLAVPPAALQDVLRRVQHVLQKHRVIASLYAHAASGQVHLRPFLPLPRPADGPRIEALAREVYEIVVSVGGTISGEHGDGLSRTAFLRTQYGPLYRVFRELKQIFDPLQLLNPDKIVSDDPHLTIKHFRPLPGVTSEGNGGPRRDSTSSSTTLRLSDEVTGSGLLPPVVPLQLTWTRAELAEETLRCNGCGVCRTLDQGLRMCPMLRIDPREEASPRAKANAIRTHLAGGLDPGDVSGDEMKQLANLCFNCKQCQLECPSNVDIPHLMIEAKAQYVAEHGLRQTDWVLSRAHSFGGWGCRLAPFSNWLLNTRPVRWGLERLLGIAAERKLPRFARRTFLDSLRNSQDVVTTTPLPAGTVVYFVDYFVNYHDPQLGWAFVKLLRSLQIPVYVPPAQTASGLAMISAGDLAAARRMALENLRTLGAFAREGHPIVCTEPAAVIALQQEYPRLVDHPDVAAVAAQAIEAGAFLQQRLMSHAGGLAGLAALPFAGAYHTPCHTRAVHPVSPYLDLLGRVPELQVESLHLGCSGMAGAFGLARENFQTSLAIGRSLIERMVQPGLQLGITECSSCKLQMEQGTSTPTLHPIKLLALACGLLPEVRLRLAPNTKRYLVS